MVAVGIRALKQNASAVVARVAAGETITITDRGRPVAQMTPLPASNLASMLASGRATAPSRRIEDLRMPPPGPDVSAELQRMRDDERY